MSQSDYQQALERLFAKTKTLSLVPHGKKLAPQYEISLVPFVCYKNILWVFVSRLSAHTQQLLVSEQASVLIYPNEASAKNCFAIERVSVVCEVFEEHENRDVILDVMTQKLGDTVSLLRQLGDFHLFGLTPKTGRYIAGFGQAFDVDFSDFSFQHINPSQEPPTNQQDK